MAQYSTHLVQISTDVVELTTDDVEYTTEVTETEVTEFITVTETIEYTEVDGVIQITGRDVQVEDVTETVTTTRQEVHHGHLKGIAMTQVGAIMDVVETPAGYITEVDESTECGQITEALEVALVEPQASQITEVDTILEFQRITEVQEVSEAGQITEVDEVFQLGQLITTESANVKRSPAGQLTEVCEFCAVSGCAHIPRASETSEFGDIRGVGETRQVREIDVDLELEVDTTLFYTERPAVTAVKNSTQVAQTKESFELDAELERQADNIFFFGARDSSLAGKVEQTRNLADKYNPEIQEIVVRPTFVYQQRPPIRPINANSSMTTLNHRSSYSDSTSPGASTDGFFKTPHTYPPVPQLPAQYNKDTLVNVNLGGRMACTEDCRPANVDQAQKLVDVLAAPKGSTFKPFFRILLLAAFVVLCTLGVAAILVIYIWTARIEANYWYIVAAVPQGTVLLITTFATKVIIVCIPFLLAIMAYYIATAWMMRNASVTQVERRGCGCVVTKTSDNQTTTIVNEEYGLLLGMLKGATIFTLWATIRYYVFRTTSSQRKATSKPLIQAFSVLLVALLILYCVLGLDLALHHASSGDFLPIKGPAIPASLVASSDSYLYGRSLKSECLSPNANGTACTVTTQTVLGLPAFNTTTSFQEGIQTLAGLSSTNLVTVTPFQLENRTYGQMALLVDSSHGRDEAFTAQTVGVRTQCELISPYCDMVTHCDANHSPPSTHPNITTRAPTCTAFSCSMPNWPIYWDAGLTNGTSFFVSEPLEIRNEPALYSLQAPPSYLATGHNSFRFFASLGSYVDSSTLQSVCTQRSASGVCTKGKDDGYVYSSQAPIEPTPFYRKLITGCTVSIMDVEYEHFNGKYTIRQETAKLSNSATALALSSVLYTEDARTTAVGTILAGLATSNANSTSVASTMETSVSRMILGMGHAAFEAKSAVDVVLTLNIPITTLPTSLVAAFVAFLVLFSLLTIALAVLALLTINKGLWIQREKVQSPTNRKSTTGAPSTATAPCDTQPAQEHAPVVPPHRSSTMPAPTPVRLCSDKTVVGDDDDRALGYCS